VDTPHVAIGMPCQDWMWTKSVQGLISVLLTTPGCRLLMPTDGCTIARKRNVIVEHFLAVAENTHLLFLDSDMLPPADVVERLAAHDQDVVAALCFGRWAPYPPMAGRGTAKKFTYLAGWDPARPLIPVDWVGTGCVLIKRRVFEKLPAPWFVATDVGLGSDSYFCEKARGKGFGVFVDVATVAGHIGAQSVDLNYKTKPWLNPGAVTFAALQ
jgi:hypothetical protein